MTKFNIGNIRFIWPLSILLINLNSPSNAQQLRLISNTGPKKIKVFYTPLLPANTILIDSLALDSVGSMTFKIDKPVMAMLYVDLLMPFTIYLHPRELTTVTFNEEGIKFSQPSEYYQDKKQQAGFISATARTYMLPASLNLKEAFRFIDSLYRVESVFLDVQRASLPAWFADREASLLKVQALTAKLIAANNRRAGYADILKLDRGLKNVIRIPADADMNYQPEYYLYLSFYFFKTVADSDTESYPVRHRKVLQAMRVAKFPEKTIENYTAYWLSYMIPTIGNTTTLADYAKLWQDLKPSVLDQASLILIDGMMRDKANELNNVAVLKNNSEVPAIDFQDKSGNHVSLSKWKGKWIYLDFWATWCAPCLIDMAKKKDLGFDQLGDGIVLVNVCADSNRDAWIKAMNELEPLGINLYADKAIKERLFTEYQIKGFPHYVIIRPDGKVEQNAANGPVQVIEKFRNHKSLSATH